MTFDLDCGFNVLEACRNFFSLLNIRPQNVAGVIFFESLFF